MPSQDEVFGQFKVLMESYFRSDLTLEDAQNILRRVTGHVACLIIKQHLTDRAASQGYQPPKPHLESESLKDPTGDLYNFASTLRIMGAG